MDVKDFLLSLTNNSLFVAVVSFIVGWVVATYKRKNAFKDKGLPQIYSCVIRRNDDIENIESLISSSKFIYKGTFVDEVCANDGGKKSSEIKSQLILEKLPRKNVKDFEEKMFFIYIKNSMERNISVKDIINANNVKAVFYNSNIKQFEPAANGCIFIKDVERPMQFNIDVDGSLIAYKITEREGYIAPNVSRL